MDRRHFVLATLVAATSVAPPAWAREAPPEVAAELPGARLIGTARLRWFGLHIYDARLWAGAEFPSSGARSDHAQYPLALEIEYARALDGKLIAERSIEEMRRSGPLPAETETRWLRAMTDLLPDVKTGDRITGVQRPGTTTRFFYNGALRGEVRDADFTRRFFGIWLAPATSEPKLRESLLGRS